MKDLIIFGNSDFSRLLKWHIDHDDNRKVIAFCANKEFVTSNSYEGLPLIAFEEIEKTYSPNNYDILLGIGYSKMNEIRKEIYYKFKQKGYKIASYIHSTALVETDNIGEGNIILERTLIEPFVSIGNGNLLWNSISIGHDNVIGNFNTISGLAGSCGYVTIKDNCFIGKGSIIKDHITVNEYSLIGAGAYVAKDVEPYSVIAAPKSSLLKNKISTDFI